MRPLFSIGVTTICDRKEMLIECITSILAQTFSDFEIIVGNDNPKQLLSSELLGIHDKRIRFVNHENNLGEIYNMNTLMKMSRGRYFTWLADDDMQAPSYLMSIHEALEKYHFSKVVFTSYVQGELFNDRIENNDCEILVLTGQKFIQMYLSRRLRAIGCYGMFEIKYLKQVGGMHHLGNGASPYCDNFLAIKSGLIERIVYINAPLIFFRTHNQSISFTNPSVDDYSSAQEDLLSYSIEIFKNERLKEDFEHNLFLLLKWFMSEYFTVMRRSGKLQWKKLIKYLLFIFGYIARLRNCRYRMIVIAIHNTFNLIRYFINRDISKIRKAVEKCKLRI